MQRESVQCVCSVQRVQENKKRRKGGKGKRELSPIFEPPSCFLLQLRWHGWPMAGDAAGVAGGRWRERVPWSAMEPWSGSSWRCGDPVHTQKAHPKLASLFLKMKASMGATNGPMGATYQDDDAKSYWHDLKLILRPKTKTKEKKVSRKKKKEILIINGVILQVLLSYLDQGF